MQPNVRQGYCKIRVISGAGGADPDPHTAIHEDPRHSAGDCCRICAAFPRTSTSAAGQVGGDQQLAQILLDSRQRAEDNLPSRSLQIVPPVNPTQAHRARCFVQDGEDRASAVSFSPMVRPLILATKGRTKVRGASDFQVFACCVDQAFGETGSLTRFIDDLACIALMPRCDLPRRRGCPCLSRRPTLHSWGNCVTPTILFKHFSIFRQSGVIR